MALFDIGMPKLNGYEACRRIRTGPGGAAMTLIAVTGWGQSEDKMAAQNAGFDKHLDQPVNPFTPFAILDEIVKAWLD